MTIQNKFNEGDRVRCVYSGGIYIVRRQWMNHRTPMVTARNAETGFIGYFSADELEKVEAGDD